MTRVVLELPDVLARSARKAGVLNGDIIRSLVKDELRRRKAARSLAEAMRRLHAVPEDVRMTEEERRRYVNEVIAEVRAKARTNSNASRS